MKILGIDIAKNVFQLHGNDKWGKTLLKKRLARNKLMAFINTLKPQCIVMEACGSANYWSRQFQKNGHVVKLISPQYVKPFVKTNKSDANDKNRTALVNQVRGLLAEYGIIVGKSVRRLRNQLPLILEDAENELTHHSRLFLADLYEELCSLDKKIEYYQNLIEKDYQRQEACQRLTKIEGVGPLTATALVAAVGNASHFKNGRQMAAWLGLVPRQRSSGDKHQLFGISKRGDNYLRKLLVHGARSVVYRSKNRTDKRSLWINSLVKRCGNNKACIALANKNARIV